MAVFLTYQVTYIVVFRIIHVTCEIFAIDTSFRLIWIEFPVCFEGDHVKILSFGFTKSSLDQIQRFSAVELDWKSRRMSFEYMFIAVRTEEIYVFSSIYRRKRDQGILDPIQVDNSVLLSCIESNEIFDLEIWRKDNIFYQVDEFFDWFICGWTIKQVHWHERINRCVSEGCKEVLKRVGCSSKNIHRGSENRDNRPRYITSREARLIAW